MFGLTKREQRWKAEQQAAELVVGFARAVVEATAAVRIAEAEAEAERMRKELAELRAAHGVAPSLPPSSALRDAAYNQIDRYLRNSLSDEDYADYSQALDLIYTNAPAAGAPEVGRG